ncbi:hypothetical protein ABB55_27715 [Prosthecomicrobium hirschii]|uniref:Uncharacterized protein n=2 Tax=Prosthecodimorpha hirschii TaxID=665126 RepID=A0A0P6VW68_9HYPH|nr:hypothetical protein ABB55_27715 [Prosthecomicrobium hirschii]
MAGRAGARRDGRRLAAADGALAGGARMTETQALAALVLWRAGFDTADIAGLLGLGEPLVARTLSAARAVASGRGSVSAAGAGG